MSRHEKIAFIKSCNNVLFAYQNLEERTDSELNMMIKTIVDALNLSNQTNELQDSDFFCIYLN